MKIKTNVWVNRSKMRNIINKLSLYYGLYLSALGAFLLYTRQWLFGGFSLAIAIPLWLIQASLTKWERAEFRRELEEKEKNVGK